MRLLLRASLLAALVAVGLWAWQEVGGAPERPEVVGAEHAWGVAEGDGTVLLTNLSLRNPNPFPLPVPLVRYAFLANDLPLGQGRSAEPVTLPAGGTATVALRTRVPHDAALAAFEEHLARGERSTLVVRGETVLEPDSGLAIGFQREAEYATALLERLRGLRTCADHGSWRPCVNASEHRWVAVPNGTGLASSLEVRNPLPFRVPLGRLDVVLRLHGERVAAGASEGTAWLPAGGSAWVNVTTAFEHDGLRAWWPKHVASCERSPATVDVGLTYGQSLRASFPSLDLGPFETRLACRESLAPS